MAQRNGYSEVKYTWCKLSGRSLLLAPSPSAAATLSSSCSLSVLALSGKQPHGNGQRQAGTLSKQLRVSSVAGPFLKKLKNAVEKVANSFRGKVPTILPLNAVKEAIISA